MQSRAAVLGSTPRVRIVTPALQGSLNLKGAQIDDLVLLKQRQTIDKNSPPVRLLSPLGAPGAYVASFGWVGQGAAAPDLNTLWQADSAALTPDRPVTLTTQMPDGTRYEMKIAVDGGYLFTVDQRVINGPESRSSCARSDWSAGATKSSDPDLWTNHVGPIGVFDGKANYQGQLEGSRPGQDRDVRQCPGLARLHRPISG